MSLYSKTERERGFAYKCIGMMLRRSKNNDFVNQILESVIPTVNFNRENERDGWAAMFGLVSTTHLDLVLQRVELYLKLNDGKGSGSSSGQSGQGIFGFRSAKPAETQHSDFSRATVLLSYAYISIYSSLELIVSRLETSILLNAVKIAQLVREEPAKMIVAKAFGILAQSMNKEHLKTDFTFSSRNDLIGEIIKFIAHDGPGRLTAATFKQMIEAAHSFM